MVKKQRLSLETDDGSTKQVGGHVMAETIDALLSKLEAEGKEDIIDIIEDTKKGRLEEIELVESIGLLYDLDDNRILLQWLQEQGVQLNYVTDEEEEEEK